MEKKAGKYKIDWVEGFDSLGRPIKYRSIVPVVESSEPKPATKPLCYSHTWEYYEGFLVREKKCTICGLVEHLYSHEDR